jgi:hypothetical protein
MFSDEFDDDHCVVHLFIRRHGRGPTPEEIAGLWSTVGTDTLAVAGSSRLRAALTQVVRREVVRLTNRP